jgi:hypothetical protein
MNGKFIGIWVIRLVGILGRINRRKNQNFLYKKFSRGTCYREQTSCREPNTLNCRNHILENRVLDNMNQVLENHVLENMFSISIMFSKKVYPISTQERDYKQKYTISQICFLWYNRFVNLLKVKHTTKTHIIIDPFLKPTFN